MLIAHFLPSTSINPTALSTLLLDAVTRLIDCGFLVTAMICDQGRNNVSALNDDLKMTKEKPYIEVSGRRIYFIFDVLRIYKNLRTNFKTNSFVLEGNEIHFQNIRDVYEIDKKCETNIIFLKITDNHINLGPFQLMSCKLAMQLLSNIPQVI